MARVGNEMILHQIKQMNKQLHTHTNKQDTRDPVGSLLLLYSFPSRISILILSDIDSILEKRQSISLSGMLSTWKKAKLARIVFH